MNALELSLKQLVQKKFEEKQKEKNLLSILIKVIYKE